MTLPIQPGTLLLGKYRVERLLGRGGMGVVVAARHLDLEELFAIKFLLPEALQTPQAAERFLQEARAAARLKGPHVAKVHDVGRLESGSPYMVMEHLDGTDLRKLVRQRRRLPIAEAILYVLQACEALAEAHAVGIVHRDLKPANLFLTRAPDGGPWIKVLDFGVSKQLVSGDAGELTATGLILGSPLYMAPEQLRQSKQVDARADIWSLGVVLYELLTGTTPFCADALFDVAARVLREAAAPPSQHCADLPPALDAIVLRCLEPAPENRFRTMTDLAQALRSFQFPEAFPGLTLASLSLIAQAPVSGRIATAPGSGGIAAAPVSVAAAIAPASSPVAIAPPSEASGAAPPEQVAPEHEDAPTLLLAPASHSPLVEPPSLANTPGGHTASAWGNTGARLAVRNRGRLVAAIVAGVVLLATGGLWLARPDSPTQTSPVAAPAAPERPAIATVPPAPTADPAPATAPDKPAAPSAPDTGTAPAADMPSPAASSSAQTAALAPPSTPSPRTTTPATQKPEPTRTQTAKPPPPRTKRDAHESLF